MATLISGSCCNDVIKICWNDLKLIFTYDTTSLFTLPKHKPIKLVTLCPKVGTWVIGNKSLPTVQNFILQYCYFIGLNNQNKGHFLEHKIANLKYMFGQWNYDVKLYVFINVMCIQHIIIKNNNCHILFELSYLDRQYKISFYNIVIP